jgi:1-acyl-sn-glycerol-3-phosphate acyltransferase
MPSATADTALLDDLGPLPDLPPVAAPEDLERLYTMFAPLRALFRPTFDGWANLPAERPLLFVGNHTLYGVVDVPHLFFELHRREGIFLRSLGDHAHWAIPGWRDVLARFGAVDGTPENCAAIFAAGGSVLVFPGGAREAFKSPDQRYQLLWDGRLGFARMALRHRVTIVPFAALGADEIFDIGWDKDALKSGPLGGLIEALRIRDDLLAPLPRIGRSALPRPQRLYFRLCPPVHTRQYGGEVTDEAATAVRDATRAAIEAGLDDLQRLRAQDPMADLSRWVGRRLGEGLGRVFQRR